MINAMQAARWSFGVLLLVSSTFGQPNYVGAIDGAVRSAATQSGLSGVQVLLNTSGEPRREAQTAATGHFRFTGLKPADYSLNLYKDGYVDARSSPKVSTATAKVNIEMTPWSKLSGRVFDADRKPAAGVRVELVRCRSTAVRIPVRIRSPMPTASSNSTNYYRATTIYARRPNKRSRRERCDGR
jgi:Carboxypeptidase regulatory-like domain